MVYENLMIVCFEYFHYMSDCPPGFFAVNCSRKCLYPYYGATCNQSCRCNKTHCNFVDGCETGKYIYSVLLVPRDKGTYKC